jgi:hypothetical protein
MKERATIFLKSLRDFPFRGIFDAASCVPDTEWRKRNSLWSSTDGKSPSQLSLGGMSHHVNGCRSSFKNSITAAGLTWIKQSDE